MKAKRKQSFEKDTGQILAEVISTIFFILLDEDTMKIR
jgi:hypothetical protein